MEVLYYFDEIPKELVSLILHNLDEETLTNRAIYGTDIGILDDILRSPKFWNDHVRLTFPDTPFEFVLSYQYKYDGQNIISIVENYGMFRYHYRLSKVRMKLTSTERRDFVPHKFRVASITDAQILVNILSPHFKSTIELYNKIAGRWRDVIIEISHSKHFFVFEDQRYEITYRQAFGLFLHFICNNHYEIST